MMSWASRHLQTLVGSLGRLSQQPLATGLTVLVMGIALALPASLNVLVKNAQAIGGSWQGVLDVSVYLKISVDSVAANELMAKLKRHKDIKQVRLINAEDALKEFREYSGFGEALEALRDNPLPNTLVVTPAQQRASPNGLNQLSEELRKFPEVKDLGFE
jgi:cell division transport system permease protein